MKNTGMFAFTKDERVAVMLGMAKEAHTTAEVKDLLARFNRLDQADFVPFCVEHQCEGMVGAFLVKYAPSVSQTWQELYDGCLRKASEKLAAAKDICQHMHEHGIDMIVLKNGGILADIIDDPAKMPMGDIDTVVRKADFIKAYEIMLEAGYKFEYSNEYEVPDIQNALRDGDAEFWKNIATDHLFCCEIAWRIVAGRWMRPDCEPDTESNFSRMHYAKDSYIGILDPVDNLVQVCIHTAKHSYLRAPGLRLNLDVERIVRHYKIDWDLFLQKINVAHTKTAAYYSLYIANGLFDTPIPERVLEALRPSKHKQARIEKMLMQAGFLHPKKRKFSKLEFLRFQTALYDSFSDMVHTLYPNMEWMKQRYGFTNSLLVPKYIVIRGLDLLGIRKKQK